MSITINGNNTNELVLKQKEGKTLSFTYSVSLTDASFSFICKNSSGIQQFIKTNEDFDISQIANNKISVILTTSDLDLETGIYDCELKVVWDSVNSVDKTSCLKLRINQSVH